MVLHRLGLNHVDFHSDSLQLVTLLNSRDPPELPDWRMSNLIQCLPLSLSTSFSFLFSDLQYPNYVPSCSYEHLDQQYLLMAPLLSLSVPLDSSRDFPVRGSKTTHTERRALCIRIGTTVKYVKYTPEKARKDIEIVIGSDGQQLGCSAPALEPTCSLLIGY
jgi:hypothetical protein